MATLLKTVQDFYKQTLSQNCGAGAGNIYVSTKPTPSSGWLVINPSSATKREIVYYSSTGTDGSGDYVVIASGADRGLGGTTAQAHSSLEPIRLNMTTLHWEHLDSILVTLSPKNNPTFTGNVTVPTPVNATDAARKDYVDTGLAGKVPIAGDMTIDGIKTFSSPTKGQDPVAGNDFATKSWVLGAGGIATTEFAIANADLNYNPISSLLRSYYNVDTSKPFILQRDDKNQITDIFTDKSHYVVSYTSDRIIKTINRIN